MITVKCKMCGFELGILKMNIYMTSFPNSYRHDIQYDLLMLRPYRSKVVRLSDFIEIVYDYYERCPRCGRKLDREPDIRLIPKGRVDRVNDGNRVVLLKEW
ncbi:MAG: hypothetical protein DRN03_05605 [Thermoplasmata archaeon]|nr:MAG: hypothetical protein DRN03_05605 [Thermoplasmata archaeon]